MRMTLTTLILALMAMPFASSNPGWAAEDPPGMIVIRPKPKANPDSSVTPTSGSGSSTSVSQRLPLPRIVEESLDHPGYLVIRPRGTSLPGSTARSNPSASPYNLPSEPVPDHYGSVIVVRPKSALNSTNTSGSSSSNVTANAGGLPAPPQATATEAPVQPTTPQKPAVELPQDPTKGKLVRDTWDAVFVKNMHIGFIHTAVREFEKDGSKFLYATKELRQTVSRFGQRVEMFEEETTFETPEGQVLVYRRRQGVGRNQMLAVTGTVSGKSMALKGEGQAAGMDESIPWPEGVIGIAKEATLVKEKGTKAGESFTYQMFAGQVNWVAKYTVTVKSNEQVALYAGEKPRDLIKVEVAMDPIRDKQGVTFSLPVSTIWHDASNGEPLKAEFDMPPLGGLMVVTRTTKEAATRTPGLVPELFDVQSIKLNKSVPGIHQLSSVTYRVTIAKDADPQSVFVRDGRQSVANFDAKAKAFDFTVRTGNGEPAKDPKTNDAYLKECLGTSFYIDWNTDETKRHAAAAIANLPANATAIDKAKAVESWVRQNMRSTEFSQAMASCGTVAKSLSGDCTEYSMLACGMCRSLGIPSRTTLGLVYAPDKAGQPYLAFHMWYEVYDGENWTALDGTLAMGRIGPGHIKISDANWHNETSMSPLFPVLRVLMVRPTVEVEKATR
ncbi:MAG: transglutaminase-like domain-containing protein [Gemmataceae bacterium]